MAKQKSGAQKFSKILIIYAHPDTTGHCSTLRDQTIKQLEQAKMKYELIDLYKIKYDPILHEEEHYTVGNRTITKQNLEFQKKITEAEKLIFIYPIWWGSMPAIMKGWVDRVLTSPFAFQYVNGRPVGKLKGKKSVVFITSGAPIIVSRLFCDVYRQVVNRGILGFCGIKTKVYQVGSAQKLTDAKIKECTQTVEKGLKWLMN